jgi:hypothetical protein
MDSDKKTALGTFLLIVGSVWFLFILIWMPPITLAVLWFAFKVGFGSVFDSVFISRALLFSEAVFALSAVGAGLYLNFHALSERKVAK